MVSSLSTRARFALKAVFYIKTFKGTFLENVYQIVEDYESECYA